MNCQFTSVRPRGSELVAPKDVKSPRSDADLGQTVILGADARVKPDGGGVKAVVLGKKGFVEAVITEAHFVDLGERERGEIGDGQKIDIGGRDGIVAG